MKILVKIIKEKLLIYGKKLVNKFVKNIKLNM